MQIPHLNPQCQDERNLIASGFKRILIQLNSSESIKNQMNLIKKAQNLIEHDKNQSKSHWILSFLIGLTILDLLTNILIKNAIEIIENK